MNSQLEMKVTEAIHRIEDLYFKTDGKCWLSFSGGKDSTVVLALIKMSIDSMVLPEEGIKAVFCDTGIELGATRDFVNWCISSGWYPNIDIIRPEKTFSEVIKEHGKPLRSKMKSELLSRWQKKSNKLAYDHLLYKFKDGVPRKKTALADKDIHFLDIGFDIAISNKCCTILKKKPFSEYNKKHDMKGYMSGVRNSEGGQDNLLLLKRKVRYALAFQMD